MSEKWEIKNLEGGGVEMSFGSTPERQRSNERVLALQPGTFIGVVLIVGGIMFRFSKNRAPEIVKVPAIVKREVPHTYFYSEGTVYWAELHGGRVIIFDPKDPDTAQSFPIGDGFVERSLMNQLVRQRPEFVAQTEMPKLAGQ